jgi:hypothetical protein
MRNPKSQLSADKSSGQTKDNKVEKKSDQKPKGDRKLHEKAATVPHDAVNEQVVIAAALVNLDERKKLVRQLTSDFFYARGHAAIWTVIEELERKGLVYDPATVQQLSGGDVDTDYLNDLIQQRPVVPDNLAHHVDQVMFDRQRIEFAKGPLTDALDKLHDPTTPVEDFVKLSRQLGTWFDGASKSKFLRDADDVQIEMERELDARVDRFRSGDGIYPYGIEGLDRYENGKPRLIPGAAPRMLTLVVGASGSGKTTVTNQCVLSLMAQGRRVLHGGWEVKAPENLLMFAAFSLGFSRTKLWTGDITDEESRALKEEAKRIRAGKHPLLKFMDRPFDRERVTRSDGKGFDKRRGNDWNLDVIHEHIEASGADVAIFDLFHKALVDMKPDDEKRALDRAQGIADATKTHLILLHHLNKEDLEKSPGHLPTRKAIKGSSAWLDAVDTVLATHVPACWKNIPMDTLEILVLKQKYGKWPLRVAFDYDADTGLISNGRDVEAVDDGDSLDAALDLELSHGGKRR